MNLIDEKKNTSGVVGGPAEDTKKEESAGFSFKASIDWRITHFVDSVAEDGFLVTVGPNVTVLGDDPVAIPANMDARIKLSPPKKLMEKTDCRLSTELPKLRVADHYDPYSVNCGTDLTAGLMVDGLGCEPTYFVPKSDAECSAEFWLSMSQRMFNPSVAQEEEQKKLMETSSQLLSSQRMKSQLTAMIADEKSRQQLFSSVCPPICDRWLYPILSASYAYIKSNKSDGWDRSPKENSSWSRVRIYFPEAYSRLHVEKEAAPSYMLACEVGGVVGVYLGFSMIAFTEFVAYGINIVCVVLGELIERRIYQFLPWPIK